MNLIVHYLLQVAQGEVQEEVKEVLQNLFLL